MLDFNTNMTRHIQSYVHNRGQIGVLIEIECLDDATTKTKEFLELAPSLAMQIAATNPVAPPISCAISRDFLCSAHLDV